MATRYKLVRLDDDGSESIVMTAESEIIKACPSKQASVPCVPTQRPPKKADMTLYTCISFRKAAPKVLTLPACGISQEMISFSWTSGLTLKVKTLRRPSCSIRKKSPGSSKEDHYEKSRTIRRTGTHPGRRPLSKRTRTCPNNGYSQSRTRIFLRCRRYVHQ